MTKLARKLTVVVTSAALAMCIATSASAATIKDIYKCPECYVDAEHKINKTTTSTLDVTSTNATATTSVNDGKSGVSVSLYGQYYEKGTTTVKSTGGGNSWTAGVTASIGNKGGTWILVQSTHSKCCHTESTILTW